MRTFDATALLVGLILSNSTLAVELAAIQPSKGIPQPFADGFLRLETELYPPESHLSTHFENIVRLEQELLFYSNLDATVTWPKLRRGPLLQFGDEHPDIPVLRRMLMLLGDLSDDECELNKERLFDIELHEALIQFQKRHGGKPDGILGPFSRQQLNISPAKRADQIRVNIARLNDFSPASSRYIQVNIPEFQLRLMDHGNPILEMKTIVGRKKRKTPVFSTAIDRIVVNPSWHVPKSIAYKDILPALQEDPDYLNKINIQLVTGWGNSKRFIPADKLDLEKLYKGNNYQRFWEAPGKKNTLGSVKFLTNGPYSVYLHDTSAKRLFDEPKRAFSSGCIRVEKPRRLADELMRLTQGWTPNELNKHFDQKKTRQISLEEPISLHVTYWTAFIDQDGQMNFRHDLYRRDRYELSKLNK